MPTGAIVGFWILKEMIFNFQSRKGIISYEGYMDQEAYDSGKDRMLIESCEIEIPANEKTPDNNAYILARVQALQDAAGSVQARIK